MRGERQLPLAGGVQLLVTDEDVLDLSERVGRVGTELAAQTGLLEPAERCPVAHGRMRVDAQVSGLDGARYSQRVKIDPDKPNSVSLAS